jgi:hypothetical protein
LGTDVKTTKEWEEWTPSSIDMTRINGDKPVELRLTWYQRNWWKILAVTFVLYLASILVLALKLRQETTDFPSGTMPGVEVISCGTNIFTNWTNATIRITNDSNEKVDYLIEIDFTSPDGITSYGRGETFVTLGAGQTTVADNISSLRKAPQDVKCSITKAAKQGAI